MRISGSRHGSCGVSLAVRWAAVSACLVATLTCGERLEAVPVQGGLSQAAQTDARWQPWLGCWALSTDAAEAPEPQPGVSAEVPGEGSTIRTCVTPAGIASAVRVTIEVDGKPSLEDTFAVDGTDHPIDDKTCRGSRVAEWSRSGERLFSRATITCAGEPAHAVSHLATIAGDTWIDIQGITRDGREALRVRRYRRVTPETRPPGGPRLASRGAIGVDDVQEASGKVSALVLQAALVETGARFRLSGRTMLALDRAGVADEITDLMVALSYPTRFRVGRQRASAGGRVTAADGWLDTAGPGDYLWGYAPFAYSSWGFSDYWYSPDVVIVADGEPGQRSGGGRVVNGRGYTRIEPVHVGGRTDRADSRSGDSSTSSTASSSGDSGSGSSGASSQGYSSGSSGGSDRTAQPRP